MEKKVDLQGEGQCKWMDVIEKGGIFQGEIGS